MSTKKVIDAWSAPSARKGTKMGGGKRKYRATTNVVNDNGAVLKARRARGTTISRTTLKVTTIMTAYVTSTRLGL